MDINSRAFAWACGLYEGEGSCSITNDGHNVRMSVDSSDEDAVRAYARAVGAPTAKLRHWVPNYTRKNGGTAKTMHSFTLHGQKALALLEAMWPMLSQRRREQIQRVKQARMRALDATRSTRSRISHCEVTTSRYGIADFCYRPAPSVPALAEVLESTSPLPDPTANIPQLLPSVPRIGQRKRRADGLAMRAAQKNAINAQAT